MITAGYGLARSESIPWTKIAIPAAHLSEGGMIRLETLIELQFLNLNFLNSSFLSLSSYFD